MRAQRLYRAEIQRQLCLAEAGMDFAVAYVMQEYDRPTLASSQTRDKMVQALRHIRRDGSLAERTDG